MKHKVGVTSYGRGEVRIVLEGQAVVTDVVHAVAGLHHGTQCYHLYDVLLGLAVHVGQHLVEVLGDFPFGSLSLQTVAELAHEVAQAHQFGGVGHIVYAVRNHLCLLVLGHLAYAFRHGTVGQEHEFLDEFVGILGHLEVHAGGLALLVNVEAHLASVEIHGTALETASAQFLGHAVKHKQQFALLGAGGEGCGGDVVFYGHKYIAGSIVVLFACLVLLLQNLLDLSVTETAVAPCYRVQNLIVLHLGLLVHLEDDAEGKFVFVGAQGAEVVAQAFRQHGYGAVYQVDTGATLQGLLVYGRTLGDIVAHVRYVHTHFVERLARVATVLQHLYADGIVKVLGIVRVYGEGEHVAHVAAAVDFLLGNLLGDAVGYGLHVLGVGVRQAELRQDGMHLGIVLASASQNVHHLADGVLGAFRPLHHADNGLVAVLALLQEVLGDEYVGSQGTVLGEQVGIVLAYLQCAHELLFRTLHYLYDLCFADMVAAACQHGGLHLVSVHGVHGVALGHQDGFSAIIGVERVLAVGLAVEYSLHYLRRCIQRIAIAGSLLDIVVQKHVFQTIHTKHLGRVGGQFQVSEQTFQVIHLSCILLEQLYE